jgi:putative protease
MSAKDLCALPFVDKMKKAGIVSFKIEGRNRSPEYVYTVVSEYRKALDRKLSRTEIVDGVENLKRVYNRGFSSGFYFGVPTDDDFSWSENGEQSERKSFVGKVYKYWPKVGACSVLINTGKLKVGDEVYLISDDIGIKKAVVKSIELKGESVGVAKKGDDVGVDFGMRVGKCEVYVVGKRVK